MIIFDLLGSTSPTGAQIVDGSRNADKKKESLLNRFRNAAVRTLRSSTTSLNKKVEPDQNDMIQKDPVGLLFGVPLREIADFGHPLMSLQCPSVPLFIQDAFDYLIREESTTEGIFRLSGSMSTMKNYKRLIDSGEKVEFEAGRDAHNAAGLIKLYLRELPEPLLTFVLFEPFCQAAKCVDEEQKLKLYITLLQALPRENYNLLAYIVEKLKVLSTFEEATKMGISNIATLIGPNIARPKDEVHEQQSMLMYASSASAVSTFLLQNSKKLFKSDSSLPRFRAIAVVKDQQEDGRNGRVLFIEKMIGSSDRTSGLYVEQQSGALVEVETSYDQLEILWSHEDYPNDGEKRESSPVHSELKEIAVSQTEIKTSSSERVPVEGNIFTDQEEEVDAFISNEHDTEREDNSPTRGSEQADAIDLASSMTILNLDYTSTDHRLCTLEQQVCDLRRELEEERRKREHLASLIPDLIKNQDEVLRLLTNLNTSN